MSIEIGQIVQDRYRIEALLGGGGQAAVYRAYDTRLEQTVAIKKTRRQGLNRSSNSSVRRFYWRGYATRTCRA